MKIIKIFLIIFCFILTCSCKKYQNNNSSSVFATELSTNFSKWWQYYKQNIVLSADFVRLNFESKVISKESFLNFLISGKCIAINEKQFLVIFKLKSYRKR